MKQKILRLLFFATAFAMLFVIAAACGSDEPEAAPAQDGAGLTALQEAALDGDYFIITFMSGIDFWQGVLEGFERAAAEVGANVVFTGTPEPDFLAQIEVFNQVVAMNPRGIAVTPLDPDAFVEPINAAIAAGIPVVTFDNDSIGSNRAAYLGTSNYAAGWAGAQFMAEQLGGQGIVGVVGFTGAHNQEERAQGFEDFMATQPGITVIPRVHGGDDETASSAAAAAMITANPGISGIFGTNSWMGLGVGNAIVESGNEGNIIGVAFDTDEGVLDYIESGVLSGSVAQGTQQMGYWAFKFLWAMNTDGVVDGWRETGLAPVPGSVDTGVSIVTTENIHLFR